MYQALYRKYRPLKFSEAVGQDAIVTTLKNQIRTERIGHAYLFCGTRGTGKTTLAKIFAKAVNCEDPKDGEPCGECSTCRQIAEGNTVNVVEMDAASNNGVDNIRQIVEEVEYSPSTGKYRVYIVDEAHMLSGSAFNALLKTLEEPPAYVIFILATTEVNKLPITILSRCQRYDFRRLSQSEITGRMKELAKTEGLEIEDKAYDFVARCADGSMRDALSLLDECVSFYFGETLTYEKALKVLGAVDTGVFSTFFRRINASDTAGALKVIDEVLMEGREIGAFVSDFIWYLRNLLLSSVSPENENMLDVAPEALERLKEEVKLTDPDRLMRYINIMSELSQRIRFAPDKRVQTEIAVIRLTKPEMGADILSLTQRVARLEELIKEGAFVQAPAGGGRAAEAEAGKEKKRQAAPVSVEQWRKELKPAMPEDLKRLISNWSKVLSELDPLIRAGIKMARPSIKSGKLYVIAEDEQKYRLIKEGQGGGNEAELRDAINRVCGKEVDFVITVDKGESYDTELPAFEELVKFDNIEVEEV